MVKAGQKSVKKLVKERLNGHDHSIHGYSLASKDLRSLSFTQESNCKIKAIFRIILIWLWPDTMVTTLYLTYKKKWQSKKLNFLRVKRCLFSTFVALVHLSLERLSLSTFVLRTFVAFGRLSVYRFILAITFLCCNDM